MAENKKPKEKKAEKPAKEKLDQAKMIQTKVVDPWDVLLYPHIAEKSMSMVDLQNKIVFVVRMEAGKKQIREAFEKLFDVKVADVKTERTMTGQKKAFIKLDPKNSAADIATRLGIL